MTATDPNLTGRGPDDLLDRAVKTHQHTPDRLVEGLNRFERDQLIDTLALAVRALAEPGRAGQLDDLAGDLAEALFDQAHENCDDDEVGCTGGGLPYWQEYVREVLMPVVRRYAVPAEAGEVAR